ncbi:uncharacterized protein DSM5745_10343 [Aspergillus mulundensis]|uniref:Uncharacterized protein n=1 Tax=Aspergillus mulundensis TaxID=1810919 RepID=A0A3D8QN50_9EURO|nr:hypothetical protein DSM5745_10343 [Aspergillus mulundensis]RDW63232.1 hypothetical protein DSM5745_10343 [Aspergillus mulundensis]
MAFNTSSSDIESLPAGFDIRVITKERPPVKGESCWGFTLSRHNRLHALVMGEYWSSISLPVIVFVEPNPGEERLFTLVERPDIEEAMARTDVPQVGQRSVGWMLHPDMKDGKIKVWKGPGVVTTVSTDFKLEMVKPFKRDDPRHLSNWPAGLFGRLLRARLEELEAQDQQAPAGQAPDPAIARIQQMLERLSVDQSDETLPDAPPPDHPEGNSQ